MMKPEPIVIETLTPIWTGGVNGSSDTVRETGIIGSMRWWYEAIVRGIGKYACNPLSDSKCMLDGKEKENDRNNKLCPACYLFGCGGWKRRFRLEIEDFGVKEPFHLVTFDRDEIGNNWWLSTIFEKNLNNNFSFGKFMFRIYPVGRGDKSEIIAQIKALLSIMSHVGAIGAKSQYGFGQFEMENRMDFKRALNEINNFCNKDEFKKEANKPDFYSLSNFWCYEFKIPARNQLVQSFQKSYIVGNQSLSTSYLPVSFDIRYKLPNRNKGSGLRQAYYSHCNGDKNQVCQIFGTLPENKKKEDGIGSRIFVSHLFREPSESDYFLRIWGFTEKIVGNLVSIEINKMFSLQEAPKRKYEEEITNFSGGV
ncbi:type III-B CRISPR module RAMP protein Cmr1 [Methanosarcina vacuolata]|uniref:CRISPR-associated RAMP Cmr1 n=1 Tax=Methanosarcina vacuolata Z-761 TaxID=1434123 RepID=A0A0E3LGH4_9EURY|nr:type III-B CRISPR module RAMP protein Cmr1 [Methanosarcina vacuolata]AKB42526.1 CRISPR-associated RAMP Cmr1 [Methanosarcina vacuolata Z-761]